MRCLPVTPPLRDAWELQLDRRCEDSRQRRQESQELGDWARSGRGLQATKFAGSGACLRRLPCHDPLLANGLAILKVAYWI